MVNMSGGSQHLPTFSLYFVFAFFLKQDKNDITAARTAALAGLPLYLKEDSSEVFKTYKVAFLFSVIFKALHPHLCCKLNYC